MNIILGGTHGLGWEITKELQERGEETFVTGRSYNSVEHGAGMAIDLSRDEDAERLARFIEHDLGDTALKGFFWVAGYGYTKDFADQDEPGKMAKVNFANVVPVAQAAWRKMLGSEAGGNFVIVSSTTGVRPRQNEAVYAATKFAQVGFGKSLGLESERLDSNIKVALFMPGGMRTEFWPEDKPDFLPPNKVAQRICERVAEQTTPYYEETIERGSL